MADIVELSKQDINALFNAMGEELATHSSEVAFVQLRMSAERFIVPLCGLATERVLSLLKPDQFHVYFEKRLRRFKQGPIDLVLVPIASDGTEDWNTPYCFEFKMVWSKGAKDNVTGIKKDIEKLGGYDRGYVVAVLFSFNGGPAWAPYAHKGDMEWLVKEIVSEIGISVYEGQEYRITNHEVESPVYEGMVYAMSAPMPIPAPTPAPTVSISPGELEISINIQIAYGIAGKAS